MSDIPKLVLSFGEGAPKRVFTEPKKIAEWVESEALAWRWLEVAPDPFPGATSTYRGELGALRAEVQDSVNRNVSIDQFAHLFSIRYMPDQQAGPLIDSDSDLGRRLTEILDVAGVKAAKFAYAFVTRHVSLGDAREVDHLRGAMMLSSSAFDRAEEVANRFKRERNNYRDSFRSALDQMRTIEAERAEQWEGTKRSLRSVTAQAVLQGRSTWRAYLGQVRLDAKAAIDSIKSVENTYMEAMGLQAPVIYWRNKARIHRREERSALKRLCWFFPLAIGILAIAFYFAGREIMTAAPPDGHQTVPVALYIVISAALATLSGIVFWIGRLLTKLYLSEHHLRIDAAERAVMTTTYLALTHEDAAAEVDRHIILSALFRNTPDGIVKDDGPLDPITAAGMIARLGGGKP